MSEQQYVFVWVRSMCSEFTYIVTFDFIKLQTRRANDGFYPGVKFGFLIIHHTTDVLTWQAYISKWCQQIKSFLYLVHAFIYICYVKSEWALICEKDLVLWIENRTVLYTLHDRSCEKVTLNYKISQSGHSHKNK